MTIIKNIESVDIYLVTDHRDIIELEVFYKLHKYNRTYNPYYEDPDELDIIAVMKDGIDIQDDLFDHFGIYWNELKDEVMDMLERTRD